MRVNLTSTVLELRLGAMLTLSIAPGWCILCISGALWITEAGRAGDHVLEAGQSLQLVSRGKVLIEALHAGRLQLLAPSTQAQPMLQAPIGPPLRLMAA